ncbi:uncharacterized protein FOMMEDRAFT_147624, partial [Fomitiporia mediterranea MF3/22]|uniref:uncharacterized protein n=1 Tax=Fomitiporia mediterranea (strain MF3/22) TaxID=694068 RepID=UPI000440914C
MADNGNNDGNNDNGPPSKPTENENERPPNTPQPPQSPPSTPLNSENEVANTQQPPESPPSPPYTSPSTPPSSASEDRTALIHRARAFLVSPDVVHEDPATKRRFLSEKGLRVDEIDGLLRELPPQLPPVPPRTYPQPPPSKLPYLLLGLTRIFTWITGSSAVLIFIYYKFLLPRLTRSALARRALKQHQVALLKRLNASLADLKGTQAEARTVLPSLPTPLEPAEFTEIHTLDELKLDGEAPITVPAFTLLRCTIEGLAKEGKKPTREELFSLLEERYTWLKSDEGLAYQDSLWETLSTNPSFSTSKETDRLIWTYTSPPPTQPQPTPLQASLTTLLSSFPPHSR